MERILRGSDDLFRDGRGLPAKRSERLSPLLTDVLAAILLADGEESHGYAIAQRCGVPTGSTYRALDRLEAAGLVESRAEVGDGAASEGRPPRTLYNLTSAGETALATWHASMRLNSTPTIDFFS